VHLAGLHGDDRFECTGGATHRVCVADHCVDSLLKPWINQHLEQILAMIEVDIEVSCDRLVAPRESRLGVQRPAQ
jgi:hypothetical protein